MKKIHILGIAAIAMLAFSVVGIASASAATLQWLAATKAIAAAEPSETTGELTLGSTNGGGAGIKVKVLCSGIFDGSVGPGPEDLINELLTLGKVLVTLAAPLACTNLEGCEKPEVNAVNLPWLTRLELMGTEAAPVFLDVIQKEGSEPGWEVTCTFPLIGKITETCTAPAGGTVLKNGTGGEVTGVFEKEAANEANCTAGGAKSGFVLSEGNPAGVITLNSKAALAVSYE